MHLTLRFLGELAPQRAVGFGRQLPEVVRSGAPLRLRLEGLGTFPSGGRPRVVWVGLAGDLGLLSGLQGAVEELARRFGVPGEERGFHPHLTLGRVREVSKLGPGWRSAVASASVQPVGWTVREVQLMRSELRPEGARYTELASVRLGGFSGLDPAGGGQ
jgi:2'-5' RNA ligase